MAAPEFQALLDAGYSEAFLRTPSGGPAQLRQQYLVDDQEPETCRHCGLLFKLPRKQLQPVLNAAGVDMRYMYSATVLDNGYCTIKCEKAGRAVISGDLFGVPG